ncbi:MAG: hypothetical protein RH917_15235 [Lacipirellulaceae bacterium]
MTYQGTVSNGVVVFEPGVVLPEGAKVSIEVETAETTQHETSRSQVEIRDGIPVFLDNGSGFQADMDLVNRLRDEER